MTEEGIICPGCSLPAGASASEYAEACRGCTVADCASRHPRRGISTRTVRFVAFSSLLFAAVAAVLLLLRML